MRAARFPATLLLLLALIAAAAPARATEPPDLLLEVRLEQHLLADAVGAYQRGGEVYLPLGELARLLTIAVRTDPALGLASGYILAEQRGFHLDLARAIVTNGERQLPLDAARVMLRPDDIYVASALLAAWLPVDLTTDLASLTLQVRPREKLPLQARLERQAGVVASGSAPADPGYARLATPYRLASPPFIDQTVSFEARRAGRRSTADAGYAAFITADLLGMEAALYLNRGQHAQGPAARLTLGRHDPEARLLGVLHASTVQLGSVNAPGVANVALGYAGANGVTISNRPLGQPTHFDSHSLQGELAPGWDVELYVNDALIGSRQSQADGRYRFDDQPLVYGPNEFRLVFHGPLGQLRIERHSFLLEQSAVAPGQLTYSLTEQRQDDGAARSVAQFHWGLSRQLSASAAMVRLPLQGQEQRYATLGLHGYWNAFILSASVARSDNAGQLAEIGIKTRLGALALSASHAQARDFASEFYSPTPDPVRSRDELRIDGHLAPLTLSLSARRDRLASGTRQHDLSARLSAYRYGTALSHVLRWQSTGTQKRAEGIVQASRRVAGIGIGGQLHYALAPKRELSALALSADKYLGDGLQLGASITRSFADAPYRLGASLAKGLGRFGLSISGQLASGGQASVGVQLFMATGREPRRGVWLAEAAPMADSGAISARVFLDKNRNGAMDSGDEPIAGAGFTVNGGRHLVRTDEGGIAYLSRLQTHQHLDIGIDSATLEDPQWIALRPGVRLVPRAGKVSELDFAISTSGEIDGTTRLLVGGIARPVGELDIELLDASGSVVAGTRSASDGYYILAGIAPGNYQLRIAPAQLNRLGLSNSATHSIRITPDANLVSGKDFLIHKPGSDHQ